MIDVIKESWGWIGIDPQKVIGENAFGNLLIQDTQERYWRICPEDLDCKIIAENSDEYEALLKEEVFLSDWEVQSWVVQAREKLGSLSEGKKYCLKIPGILGGKYNADNFGIISFEELISASGALAQQIEDLPDGTQIELSTVD